MRAARDRPLPEAREPVLVVTKLHPPALRPGHVPRPHLVQELRRGAAARVTLIRAPAGGGKTTLLSEWLALEDEALVAWLSLDGGDGDPVRFWTYVLEALRTAGVPAPGDLARDLRAPGTRAADVVLPRIVNLLAGLRRRLILVLDDLHEVRSDEVLAGLRFLIERMPAGLHVCLASRTEPPERLGLARLRARGEVTDIRAAHLRFTVDEAARLLAAATGRDLGRGDVMRLQARTEGWAAGLYLAALSLRGRHGAAAVPAEIAGDDHHLAEFLTAEILAGLPADTRGFLLRTSILQRLCGDLCDRVAGVEGAGRTLDEIERSNLLVVPLDNRRVWFRYHHLFRDLLLRELEREAGAARVRALHRAAAQWWEEHAEIPEAFQHALAAEDAQRAARLAATHWHAYLERGQLETAAAWLDALRPELIDARADLLLARAWVELNRGRPAAAARAVDAAEASEPAPTPPGLPSIEAGVPMVRAVVGYMIGDIEAATAAGRRALEACDPESPWVAMAAAIFGTSLLWNPGAGEDADAALTRAIECGAPGENMIAVLHAHAAQGLLRLETGERAAALRALERARAVRDGEGLGEYPWAALTAVLEGRLREEAGELEPAAGCYSRAAVLAARGRVAPEQAYALIRLARARAELGEREAAQEALREARRVLGGCRAPGVLLHALAAAERRAPPRRGDDPDELSEREIGVLRLLTSSLTQAEIAATLYVSVNTVKTHVRTIYRKLGATSREEAVARARERSLL